MRILISVITPTHDTRHLAATYASLRAQSLPDWDWVVVPNGGISSEEVEAIVGGDPRVKIRPYAGSAKIGAIKLFAFMQGVGDILVELDHDDRLTDNALEEIVKAFQNPNVDFVYSNSADCFDNGNFHTYPEWQRQGWRYRDATVHAVGTNGEASAECTVLECVAFQPSANALGLIYLAPNHVRAWRASFYRGLGGHDPTYAVCDDHELLVRTYLKGTMRHIDKCLYLYRMGEQNTFSKRLDEIRTLTNDIYVRNIEALVVRDGELRKLPCYDLGGGINPKTGWTPVDRELDNGPGVQADLAKRWPFEDSSVLAFRAHDFVEHIADKQHVMAEIHRCLVPGGWAFINVPSTDGRGAFQDPTHVSYWNENSFWYYTRPEQAQFIRNTETMFITRRLFTYFPSDWHKSNNIPYTVAELIAAKGDMSEVPGSRP